MPLLPLLVSLLRQSGERLTPARLRALPDDAPLIVRDDGGRLIRLPAARVKPILAPLIELYDEQPLQKDGSLRLPRWSGVLLADRSEEHTSELQSLMHIQYAVFCLNKHKITTILISKASTTYFRITYVNY